MTPSPSTEPAAGPVTYRPLAVQQRRVAARRDGPAAELENVGDLLSQLGGVFMLRHEPHAPLFGHILNGNRQRSDFMDVTRQSGWLEITTNASKEDKKSRTTMNGTEGDIIDRNLTGWVH